MRDAPAGSPAHRILVAADDPLTRALAREAIAREGWRFEAAANVDEVLARLEREPPDALLVDADLPDRGGLHCCAELQRRRPEAAVPVVVMLEPGRRSELEALRAYPHGDFVARPVDWHLLGARVRALLERSAQARELQRRVEDLARTERIAGIGTWEWNADGREMRWSDQTCRLLGWEPGAVQSSRPALLERVHPEDREPLLHRVREARDVTKAFTAEVRVALPNGLERRLRFEGERRDAGETGWLSGTLQDVTEQSRDREELTYLANFDGLTGLANRRLFAERLERSMAAARRKDHKLALLYLDIDQFKRVNDSLGHAAGDRLLQHVAATLMEHVRGSDLVGRLERPSDEVDVSRLGGDEFTILLSKVAAPEDAGDVARRILEALAEPISMDGFQISSRASSGIAIYPGDGDTPGELARNAETALYHAKDRGRGDYQFYSDWMNEVTRRKLSVESRLRQALERERLSVHYQPRVDLRSRRIIGMEALLRWEDEELGRISPKEIIPLAEDTGLIVEIGRWVLERSCAQVRTWQREGLSELPVSVNVSIRQFGRHDLAGTISRALLGSGLDPRLLEIEITEGLLLQDDEETAIELRDLRAMGVRVALDDFGTGYSSLSYVTRFPLDTLKLDKCFVRDVHTDPSAEGVATAVIDMAHSLSLRVVAEGIDEEEQARVLLDKGCDEAQGFLFSGAVPADEFAQLLRSQSREGGE